MSVSARLISGTVASWVQIGVTLITQIMLVPLYLNYWNVEMYGLWLAVLSITSILNSLDLGYQEFLAYEFLKIGRNNPSKISAYLSSGLLLGFFLGMSQILMIIVLFAFGLLSSLFGESSAFLSGEMLYHAGIVLLIQGFAWMICGSIGGILTRTLAVFGYYPRMAWWGVYSSICTNLAPAVAVVLGADLLETGITMAAARILSDVPIYIDMLLLLKREKVTFISPSFRLGWNNFLQSLYLSVAGVFENIRQQGARLFLTPLTGVAGLAAFSMMRTGTNIAMQGLHTVTNPLMPELMRFLHKRDQIRSEVAFGTVWIVTVVVLAPVLVVVQVCVEPLFLIWTRGQIPFNPWLFGFLSIGILVYAISQPAISVVRGNNLLKSQVFISSMTGGLAIAGIFILVPQFGIAGAGVALLTAEIAANLSYRFVARKWLNRNGLNWPTLPFSITVTSVVIASIAISMLVIFPEQKWILLPISLCLLGINSIRYWQTLPVIATERARNILAKLPGSGFLFNR